MKGFASPMQALARLVGHSPTSTREAIVAEALGNIEANCDGCMPGLAEMYQAYIDGEMELRECNAAFNRGYISGKQGPERGGSCLQGL